LHSVGFAGPGRVFSSACGTAIAISYGLVLLKSRCGVLREFLFCIFTAEKFSQFGSSGGSDSECEEFGLPGKFFNGGAVLSKTTRVLFAVVACAFVVTQATAQDDAEKAKLSLGGGIRAGASWGDVEGYGLNDIRLYANGSAYGWLGLEVNTETSSLGQDDGLVLLDAVAKLGFSDNVNVWVGRFLAPSDRANLSGPYYGNVGNDHARGSRFYMNGNEKHGRDDGLAVSGKLAGSGADGEMNLKYAVGIFDGHGTGDDDMFAGRVTLNLWDNEAGYYNASTYYGEKDILAIGIAYQTESSVSDGLAVGTPQTHAGTTTAGAGGGAYEDALSVDILLEKNLDMGTVTLDLAWSDYSGTAVAESVPLAADGEDGSADADSISLFAAILLKNEVALGPISGQLRPYIRLVTDGTRGDEFAIGVQHVIDGHAASITLEYGDWDGLGTGNDGSAVSLGAQFQF